jgi:hypothetical protein
MTHRWKSAQNADSHTMLGKASHKTATLSHISHSPDDDSYTYGFSCGRQQCQPVCTNRRENLSSQWGALQETPQRDFVYVLIALPKLLDGGLCRACTHSAPDSERQFAIRAGSSTSSKL